MEIPSMKDMKFIYHVEVPGEKFRSCGGWCVQRKLRDLTDYTGWRKIGTTGIWVYAFLRDSDADSFAKKFDSVVTVED